jgi:putative ABC transport system permease protein
MSLALATLIYEWRRYLAAMVALACGGLLVLVVIGLLAGIIKSATATIDRSRADIIILGPRNESLVNSNISLPTRIKPLIYMHPEVVEVEAMQGAGAQWTNIPTPGVKQQQLFVAIRAVDTRPGSVMLPVDYSESVRLALTEPGSVVVDQSALGQLGVKLGGKGIINGHKVTVRAVLTGYPNIDNVDVIVSQDTMRSLGFTGRGDGGTGPLMVRIKDPDRAEIVRDQLNAVAGKAYRAWTRPQLAKANEGALLKEQIVGVLLVFLSLIGGAIGVGITSMTLRGAILANIKEFATLRALGVSMASMRVIVLELSVWVGVAGLVLTGALVLGVSGLAGVAGLPLVFRPEVLTAVGVVLMMIAGLSGVFSLGVMKKSQPADLLR